MIKLKLTRDELHVLAKVLRPDVIENELVGFIGKVHPNAVALFNLLSLADKLNQKFLFSSRSNVSITYSEGASMLNHICLLERDTWDTYSLNVFESVKMSIHKQLINYKRRFHVR